MVTSNFLVVIDFYKFVLYIEPSFFLFFGKTGAFKTMLFSNISLNYLNSVLTVFASAIALFNRLLKYNISPTLDTSIQTLSFIYNKAYIYNIHTYYKYIYKYFFFLKRLLLQIVFSIHRGWVRRLRLVGIGYKLYYFANLLILKLGYNKCIFFLLPFSLHLGVTGRKKRGFSIFGIHKLVVTIVSKLILQLRIPNVYTGKGIRMRGVQFIRKLGKKSLF